MPLESIEHSSLVTKGEKYIRYTYAEISQLDTDSFSTLGTGRLLPLLQYQPDIVAKLVDGRVIIGEAKTTGDILKTRSKKQYEEFLEHLSYQSPKGIFLLFCSWKVATSAQDWFRNHFRKYSELNVYWKVVSDVDIMRMFKWHNALG